MRPYRGGFPAGRTRGSRRRSVFLVVALSVAIIAGACSTDNGAAPGTTSLEAASVTSPTDVWAFVTTATSEAPLTADQVTSLLDVSLEPVTPYRSEGGPVSLGPDLTIDRVITAENEQGWIFTAFAVTTPSCITIDDVKAHYPDVVKTGSPRGHSLEEKFIWTFTEPWGTLNFGIKDRTKCLSGFSLAAPGK